MLKMTMTAIVVAAVAMTSFQGKAKAGLDFGEIDIMELVQTIIDKDDDDDDDDKCDWLKAKAKKNGSNYWWKRYRRCEEDED